MRNMKLEKVTVFALMCWALLWALLRGEGPHLVMGRRRAHGWH